MHTMLQFMWQDEIHGVAIFIQECLARCMVLILTLKGVRRLISPRWLEESHVFLSLSARCEGSWVNSTRHRRAGGQDCAFPIVGHCRHEPSLSMMYASLIYPLRLQCISQDVGCN